MYTLTIDASGESAIQFIGSRYAWSNTLQELGYDTMGEHTLSEPEAWRLQEAIDSDMEGGHNAYPLLDPRSTLAKSLTDLYTSIV